MEHRVSVLSQATDRIIVQSEPSCRTCQKRGICAFASHPKIELTLQHLQSGSDFVSINPGSQCVVSMLNGSLLLTACILYGTPLFGLLLGVAVNEFLLPHSLDWKHAIVLTTFLCLSCLCTWWLFHRVQPDLRLLVQPNFNDPPGPQPNKYCQKVN